MIILDTHAWLWWMSDPSKLSAAAAAAIDKASAVGICPISAWELATKVTTGKLELDRDVESWVLQALAHPRARVAALSPEIAVAAGRLGELGFHGDPADRLITATAMHHRASLVTKDRAIRDFSHVTAIW